METTQARTATLAAYGLAVVIALGLTLGPSWGIAAVDKWVPAGGSGGDMEPRALPQPGPNLRPARGPRRVGQRAANRSVPGGNADRIRLAYQKSRASRTEADYSSVIDLCQEGIALGVTAETRRYAQRLVSWAHNRRGEVRAGAGRDEDALRDFEKALQYDKTRWRAWHNRGVSYAMVGQSKQAIRDFDRTTELNPRFANAYFNRGEMYCELNDFAAALRDYTRALQLEPDDATALNSRGYVFFQSNKHREALRDFSAALRLDADNAAALTNRGDVFADLGYYAEALRDYQRSIGIDKNLSHTHQSIAWLVATCPEEQYRDPELALSAAERAVELEGRDNCRNLDTLAAAHAEAGHFDNAQRVVRQAIEIASPAEAQVYRNRLTLYEAHRPFRASPKRVAPVSVRQRGQPPQRAGRGRAARQRQSPAASAVGSFSGQNR
jgi:tetratricopeptide (TPR) repeat protein